MDFANMSPEEKDNLLSQLAEKYPDEFQSGDSDDGWREAICKVVEILIDKAESAELELKQLRSMIEDDLFGGIKNLYDSNVRSKGIEDLRGQYGDLFSPHMDSLKEMYPDEDIFEKMHDLLSEMKGQEGYTDEMGDKAIKDSASHIAEMIGKVKGEVKPESETPESVVEETKPEGGAVEVTKVSAEPLPDGADQKLIERMKRLKAKNQARGL